MKPKRRLPPTPVTGTHPAFFTRGYLAGIVAAVLIGYLYFAASLSLPVIHDAHGYYRAARQIWTDGLFSKFELSELRTYGYPALLGGLLRISDITGADERSLVFATQLAIHIAACATLRAVLLHRAPNRIAAQITSYAVLLNPFVLIYPAYMLTESISLSLMIVTCAAAIALFFARRGGLTRIAIAGSAVCGFMIAVRPANVFVAPMWAVAVCVSLYVAGLSSRRAFLVAVAVGGAFSLPLLPQLRNNFVHHGTATPLVAAPFATGQQYIGILWIKYATLVAPGQEPQVKYLNPFATDEPLAASNPGSWYMRYPGRGLATVALHAFNLLDQDLPMPYNRTLVPSYYPLVSIVNLVAVGFGLLGLAVGLLLWRRHSAAERYVLGLASLLVMSHLGLHSLFSVEARYGVAALIPLYASAVLFASFLGLRATTRMRAVSLVVAAVFTIGGTGLSSWVRSQAPAIRAEAEARGQPASGDRPGGAL